MDKEKLKKTSYIIFPTIELKEETSVSLFFKPKHNKIIIIIRKNETCPPVTSSFIDYVLWGNCAT